MSLQPQRVCPTEQDFFELWNASKLAELSPTALAEQGARLADRAAWVFVAAYQGAMQQCFPQLREQSGWASYLVSEARDDSRAPTCTVTFDGGQTSLHGRKNWVAARDHLGWLVVNATAEDGSTKNLLLAADTQGVALPTKQSGRFLPELAVGKAEFAAVLLGADAVLADATTHARVFGVIEARCLLVALAGHFAEQVPTAESPAEALMLAAGLVTSELDQPGSIKVLLEAMTLLVDWFEGWVATAPASETPAALELRERWADDRRLLTMHRPMLEKRLGTD